MSTFIKFVKTALIIDKKNTFSELRELKIALHRSCLFFLFFIYCGFEFGSGIDTQGLFCLLILVKTALGLVSVINGNEWG
jgi:hypothetical protein